MPDRRTVLRALAGLCLAPSLARATGPSLADHDLLDLGLPGEPGLARRAVVLVPKGLQDAQKLPLLVLLHGLGETGDERAGVYAWIERYGLATAYGRLLRPPVVPTGKRGDLTAEHAAELDARLAARPFRGMILACPYTPNVWRAPSTSAALDRYARWLADELVPAVRARTPALADAANTFLDGCSLGGFVGLEAFLRRPDAFGAWGGVQSALARPAAAGLAERMATALRDAGPRRLHVETSRGDPFHDANVALSRALSARTVPHDLVVLPGPHDQPWLREVGTLEMLLWHDRADTQPGAR